MLYAMPSGLYELMSDIAREVLRDQPPMLYPYIAHYMETLVRVREYTITATHLVDGVTQDNVELLSYVSSLGVPYELADLAARKIQRAFRAYRAKHNIKLAVQNRLKQMKISESFQRILDTYDLDQETADKASTVIQNAFKVYQSKKLLEERKGSRDASTHTIESISFKPSLKETILTREKKPPKRDSKLLVYQQSPRESVLSSWSTLSRDLAKKEKPSLVEDSEPKLVYQQTHTSIWTSKGKRISDNSVISDHMKPLPSYYESQPKIPMISGSGLLVSDDALEIVTLFSTDSAGESQRFTSEPLDTLPSLSNVSPTSKPEDLAKELFDIIGNKTATSTSFNSRLAKSLSGQSSDDLARTEKDPSAFVKKSPTVSVRKNTISYRAS